MCNICTRVRTCIRIINSFNFHLIFYVLFSRLSRRIDSFRKNFDQCRILIEETIFSSRLVIHLFVLPFFLLFLRSVSLKNVFEFLFENCNCCSVALLIEQNFPTSSRRLFIFLSFRSQESTSRKIHANGSSVATFRERHTRSTWVYRIETGDHCFIIRSDRVSLHSSAHFRACNCAQLRK